MEKKAKEITEKLYSLTEAAEKIGCKKRRLMYLIKKGELDAAKLGWMYVLTEDQIQELKDKEGDNEDKNQSK